MHAAHQLKIGYSPSLPPMSTHAPPQRDHGTTPVSTKSRNAAASHSQLPLEAFFFQGTGDARLFGVWRDVQLSASVDKARHVWVICPPFAEEDKSARRTLTELCQKLQGRGEASLLFSFRGTGDSDGDFADATIEAWRDDVVAACREAARRAPHARLCLLGVRLGASLAALAAAEAKATRLILIEPLLAGRPYLAAMGQRKKLRAMMTSADSDQARSDQARSDEKQITTATASIVGENGAAQATNDVVTNGVATNGEAKNGGAGDPLAVEDMDGWPVAPPLCDGLNALDLATQPPRLSPHMSTHVLQVGPRAQIAASLERFANAVNAESHAVVMRPFWNLLDYARADVLFDAIFGLQFPPDS